MMGHNDQSQDALFYSFNLEELVPADHLLRQIDQFLDLIGVGQQGLEPIKEQIAGEKIEDALTAAAVAVGYDDLLLRARVTGSSIHGRPVPGDGGWFGDLKPNVTPVILVLLSISYA